MDILWISLILVSRLILSQLQDLAKPHWIMESWCVGALVEASKGLDLRGDEAGKARILSSMGAACVSSGRGG